MELGTQGCENVVVVAMGHNTTLEGAGDRICGASLDIPAAALD